MTIVVGYVPRRDGLAALEAAAAEAARRDEPLIVVSVAVDGVAPVDPRDVAAVCRGAGLDLSLVEVRAGASGATASGAILAEVDTAHARLAVVGWRRGRRVPAGGATSTAEAVLVAAPCPVLAVREPAGRPAW